MFSVIYNYYMVPNSEIFRYADYRSFLRDYFVSQKKAIPGFSYRLFAQKAGFASPAFFKLVVDGKKNLSKESVLIDLKGFAFIAEKFPEAPKRPSSFAMLLRKHLSSAKLATVKQAGFDRIIEFTFSTKNGSKTLIVELFGKQGNLLFLDENRKIIMPFKREEYAARKLARAETYSLPPSEKKHPLELVESDFDVLVRIFNRFKFTSTIFYLV